MQGKGKIDINFPLHLLGMQDQYGNILSQQLFLQNFWPGASRFSEKTALGILASFGFFPTMMSVIRN